MRTKHILTILVLLILAVPATPAHAGGVVSVCDETHLLAALAGGGTVTFTCSGTITLTTEIVISVDTTIDGSGQAVTISGANAVRVFTVNSGSTFKLNRLTVSAGSAGIGGGIYNLGTVTVNDCTFMGNNAQDGGGIHNRQGSTLNVSNCIFSGNSATLTHGGGIYNDGGTLNVDNSFFSGNTAGNSGGAIENGWAGVATVRNSTFANNSSGAYGGGISNWQTGALIVINSTFSGNCVILWGGGISTLHYSTLSISNSTFYDNSAQVDRGGGVYNWHGTTVNITNSSFFGNRAGQYGGAIESYSDNGPLTIKNTIVANSVSGENCSGTITDGGGNLSYPDTTCPGINADPLLGPLQNNGGPTETMELLPGSAAIDAGIDATCAADPVNNLDQRGVTRPQGPHCDIGAVEQVLEPSAVRLGVINAKSAAGTAPSSVVFGLALAVLASIAPLMRFRRNRCG